MSIALYAIDHRIVIVDEHIKIFETALGARRASPFVHAISLVISFSSLGLLSASESTKGNKEAVSGPIIIDGRDGVVIEGLRVGTLKGDCVQIIDSKNVTIRNSNIGPCGGNGIRIRGGQGISVVDSYIHPETQSEGCCDRNDGIFAVGTLDLLIQGNVVAYGESNIEIHGSAKVQVRGNFLLNPRGPFPRGQNFQCWSEAGDGTGLGCSHITVENNYVLSSADSTKYLFPEKTQDSINFGYTRDALVVNNYVRGGHSIAGCGLIADIGASNILFKDNQLVDTGQCGIGIADGKENVVDGNWIWNRNPVAGGGNQGIYVWQFYGVKGRCADTRIINNVAFSLQPNGTKAGFWKGPGCDETVVMNNKFGIDALPLFKASSRRFKVPLIPPEPKGCVVTSPYSNYRSLAACK